VALVNPAGLRETLTHASAGGQLVHNIFFLKFGSRVPAAGVVQADAVRGADGAEGEWGLRASGFFRSAVAQPQLPLDSGSFQQVAFRPVELRHVDHPAAPETDDLPLRR
jgi:hypothetical protein